MEQAAPVQDQELEEVIDCLEAVVMDIAAGKKFKAVTDNVDKIWKAIQGGDKVMASFKADKIADTAGSLLTRGIKAFQKSRAMKLESAPAALPQG